MADDLDDEWWKAEDEKEVSSAKNDKKEKQGVKRPAPSDDSAGEESDEPSTPPDKATPKRAKGAGGGLKPQEEKQKKSKKKNKNGRGKFVRRKITEEDEGSLKKAGTPEDVKKLLKPLVAVSATEDSESDSDEDTLSIESDFFPANEHLSSDGYLKEVLPGWSLVVKKAKLSPGSPLILILCSSAVRAVELNREIKSFLGKECKTAKLFAKHMKLEEQKTFLQKKVCHACIGTPNRVQALLEAGSLKLNSLHGIVLDWNWRDVKMKRMADIPDVRRDLTLLLKEHALHKVKQTPCRIAIL